MHLPTDRPTARHGHIFPDRYDAQLPESKPPSGRNKNDQDDWQLVHRLPKDTVDFHHEGSLSEYEMLTEGDDGSLEITSVK